MSGIGLKTEVKSAVGAAEVVQLGVATNDLGVWQKILRLPLDQVALPILIRSDYSVTVERAPLLSDSHLQDLGLEELNMPNSIIGLHRAK